MISKNDILEAVRILHKKTRGIPDKKMFHADRDWAIGFFGMVLFVVIGVMYAGFQFVSYSKVIETETVVNHTNVKYNQQEIQEVLEFYIQKQKTFNILRLDRSNVLIDEVIGETDLSDEAL